ncbi:MAG: S8 family serine peptidase, partial [Planctomycetota bacterium]
MTAALRILAVAVLCLFARREQASAIDGSIAAIHGDQSRTLLGDGTGVVIGLLDSGIDDQHPAISNNDDQGRPRMIAEANFATTDPDNAGDDVVGHGTSVASVALSADAQYAGMAPNARFINSRVLDSANDFADEAWIRRGVAFALNAGADVLNLSLNTFTPLSDGAQQLDLMLDWAADERGVASVACAGNILGGDGSLAVRSPGSAANAIVVGSVAADLTYVHAYSAT